MRRSCVVFWIFALSMPLAGISSLAAQAPNGGAAQASTPPASSSATSANPLVTLLKSPDAGVRARAARDLGKGHDASVIPALAEALSDPSEKVRREVVLSLAQIHEAAALDALIKATQDADDDCRALAVESLVGYYTGTVPTPGFSGFVKKNWDRAKSHFSSDFTRIDPGIKVEPKVIVALDTELKDRRSRYTAREAAKGLGILTAQSAVPDLVKAAHSSDEDLSLEALNALSKIKDLTAGPPLVDLLDSPNKEIKQEAAVTVGILRTQQALPKLQSMFENATDEKTKEKGLEGLAYLADPASNPVFLKALWSYDKAMRTSAAEGLARTADPKNVPELQKAVMTEKDGDTKLALRYAITAAGKTDYLNDVVDELSSKSHGDAAQSYLVELARTPAFLPKLYPYLQSSNATVRRRLCTVLMYTGDQTSLEQLDRLEHDSNGDVVSESLRAKRAIRARLDAAAATPKTEGH